MEMREPSCPQPEMASDEQTLTKSDYDTIVEAENTANDASSDIDPEAEAETVMSEAIEEEQTNTIPLTKELLIEQAKALLEKDPAEIQRESIARIRQHYNNLCKNEVESARTLWVEEGNAPEDFVVTEDAEDAVFSNIINEIREKKNLWAEQKELERKANLQAKNEIIDQINALAEDTDNVNRTFPLYRELQDKFNALGEVPPTDETSVWKRFQEARERYSDNLKINKELRDYDFKKNLDLKNELLNQAIALDSEEDVVVAFRRLQELHDKWRQIGPVAKDIREELWNKFKDASAAVNKKYQAFFEERKARETANEEAKNALCDQIEALDYSSLKSFAQWDEMTNKIIALQNEWKTIGFASRKVNNALFARFRKSCDEFFTAKAAYFKSVKEEYAANLAKKTALAERAEALKDSTDWKKTAEQFVAMQKEWKTIGAVPKRHSDAVWHRFLSACDYFFDKKKEATSGQRAEEQANLKTKREIIDALKSIDENTPDNEAAAKLHELQDKWQQTGHVPFRDKDKVNDGYRAAVNALRQRLNMHENRNRMDRFEANISQIEGDQQRLYRERDRLVRALEGRSNEIRTYENNIGFLTSKSKSGESMLNEFRNKIQRLKEDIDQIKEKIELIDSKLK